MKSPKSGRRSRQTAPAGQADDPSPTGTDPGSAPDSAAEDVQAAHSKGGAIVSAAASLAGSVGSVASAAASVAADSMGSVARPIIDEVEGLASGARRRLDERGRARKRSSRRGDPSAPLKLIYDVHPEARRAAPRELGLKIVPIESILGTAVEGAAQRGSDFLPLKARRGADWEARFRRIQNALERLDTLPPVDLLKFGEGYWILDGHNRVGAGLKVGQVAVDANVTDLRMPGARATASRIAPYLEGSGDLRAAGTGRRRSTSVGRESVEPSRLAAERQAFHDAEEDDAVTDRARAVSGPDSASGTPAAQRDEQE